jgi:hypothetical protein
MKNAKTQKRKSAEVAGARCPRPICNIITICAGTMPVPLTGHLKILTKSFIKSTPFYTIN